MITVLNYSFSLYGLSINYQYKGASNTIFFDPCAACEVFSKLRIIDDFQLDSNGEPVIIWEDRQYGCPAMGWCQWYQFAATFKVIQRHAEIIAEARENEKSFRKSEAIINRLLSPLKHSA